MRETLENYITKLYQYNFSHKNRVYYLRWNMRAKETWNRGNIFRNICH